MCQGLAGSGGLVWRSAGVGEVSKLIAGRCCLSLCLLCHRAYTRSVLMYVKIRNVSRRVEPRSIFIGLPRTSDSSSSSSSYFSCVRLREVGSVAGFWALCRETTLASQRVCGNGRSTYLTVGNCVLQVLGSGVVSDGSHGGLCCCEVVRKCCGLRAWAQCDKTGFGC